MIRPLPRPRARGWRQPFTVRAAAGRSCPSTRSDRMVGVRVEGNRSASPANIRGLHTASTTRQPKRRASWSGGHGGRMPMSPSVRAPATACSTRILETAATRRALRWSVSTARSLTPCARRLAVAARTISSGIPYTSASKVGRSGRASRSKPKAATSSSTRAIMSREASMPGTPVPIPTRLRLPRCRSGFSSGSKRNALSGVGSSGRASEMTTSRRPT